MRWRLASGLPPGGQWSRYDDLTRPEPAGRLPIGGDLVESAAPTIDSPAEFEQVLGLGLGRAILFLRQHDAAPYRDIILNACTHWTGYDQQAEAPRTTYLLEVLDAIGQAESYIEPILAALQSATEYRDQQQLVELAGSFARAGNDTARAALYELFDRNDAEEPFAWASELIKADGLEGFLYVAERIGAALLEDPAALGNDDWLLKSLFDDAEEWCGKDAVQQALERAARERPGTQAYVNAVAAIEAEKWARRALRKEARAERSTEPSERVSPRKAPYERIKRAIVDREPPSVSMMDLRYWGRDASGDDFVWAATDLLSTENENHLWKYLQIFCLRPFPLAIDRLLALVHHPNEQVMWAASQALSKISQPRVRAQGLEILADPGRRGSRKAAGVYRLVSSFEPGDEAVLIDLLETPRNAFEHHGIGTGALDILKAHPAADAVPILLALYAHGRCAHCRQEVVELLRQRGAVPDWMLEECRYDASEYVREAADAWARGEEPADD